MVNVATSASAQALRRSIAASLGVLALGSLGGLLGACLDPPPPLSPTPLAAAASSSPWIAYVPPPPPDVDTDGDGLPDRCDQCPDIPETYNGIDDDDGCPDRARIRVERSSIQIVQYIQFETHQTVVRPHATPILDAMVEVLRDHPEIEQVGCVGHTASDERDPQKLGQRRAQSVVDELVRRGVDPGRLLPVSSGRERPIADNAMPEGRARNRRVEFQIMRLEGRELRRWNGSSFEDVPSSEAPVSVLPPSPPATAPRPLRSCP